MHETEKMICKKNRTSVLTEDEDADQHVTEFHVWGSDGLMPLLFSLHWQTRNFSLL